MPEESREGKIKILGFALSQEKKADRSVAHWYARKKLDGKMIRIYIGTEPDKAEEKIQAWLEKRPEVKEQLNCKSKEKNKESEKAMDKNTDKLQYDSCGTIPFILLEKHPDNEKLLPPLSDDEKEVLKKKMQTELEPQPFTVIKQKSDGKFWVLDGNNRLSILKELGFSGGVPCIVKKNMTIEEQRTFIENCSLGRRNLTKETKIEIAQRQVARGISQNDVAKILGISQQTVSRATEEVKEARKEAETQAVQTLREAGVTQKEVSEIVGVSKETVKRTEKETRGHFTHLGKMTPSSSLVKPSPEIAKNQAKSMLLEETILEKARAKEVEKAKTKLLYQTSVKKDEIAFEIPQKPLAPTTDTTSMPVANETIDLSTANSLLKKKDEQINELKKENADMKDLLERKEKIINNQWKEIEKLKAENEMLRAKQTTEAELRSEFGRLKKEIAKLKEENNIIKIQNQNYMTELLNRPDEASPKEEEYEEEVES